MKIENRSAFAAFIGDDDRTERRAYPRIRAIGRVAFIRSRGDNGLCRILNISDGGAMIDTALALATGERIELTISHSHRFVARVAWRNGRRSGLAFQEATDCLALLRRLVDDQRAGRSYEPRLAIRGRVLATTAAGTSFAELEGISQTEMVLRHSAAVRPGDSVQISLADGLRSNGVVVSSESGCSLVRLASTLPLDRLGSARALLRPSDPAPVEPAHAAAL